MVVSMNLAYGTNWSTVPKASATVLVCLPYIGQTEKEGTSMDEKEETDDEEELLFCYDLDVYSLSSSSPSFFLDIWKGVPKKLNFTNDYYLYW